MRRFARFSPAWVACLGGQLQFQTGEATCEAYWLNVDPQPRREGEAWSDYVSRSSHEALEAFRRMCRQTDFRSVALQSEVVRSEVERESYDPLDDLWFVLDFATEDGAQIDDARAHAPKRLQAP